MRKGRWPWRYQLIQIIKWPLFHVCNAHRCVILWRQYSVVRPVPQTHFSGIYTVLTVFGSLLIFHRFLRHPTPTPNLAYCSSQHSSEAEDLLFFVDRPCSRGDQSATTDCCSQVRARCGLLLPRTLSAAGPYRGHWQPFLFWLHCFVNSGNLSSIFRYALSSSFVKWAV